MKRTALKRNKRLKPRRLKPRRSGRKLWPEYLAVVRTLPCYVCGRRLGVEADHQGPRPFGRKADDDTTVPMCGGPGGCHQRRTDGWLPRGTPCCWERVNKDAMRLWCDVAIGVTRAFVLPMLEGAK